MKKNIYVLGNPHQKIDSLPLKIMPKLQSLFPQLSFIHLDPTEDLPEKSMKELILLDTVFGIEEVSLFHNLDCFSRSPRVSLHDFDLPLSLGLSQKLGKIKSIKIIGVPQKGNMKRCIDQIKTILESI